MARGTSLSGPLKIGGIELKLGLGPIEDADDDVKGTVNEILAALRGAGIILVEEE